MRAATAFNAVALGVALVLAAGLYKAKTDAAAAARRIERLQAEIAKAEADVGVLAAEAAALESPPRVARLAQSTLGLAPTRPEQRISLSALDAVAPAPAPQEAAP